MAYTFEGITYDFDRLKTGEALEVRKLVMKGLSGVKSEEDIDLNDVTELLAELEPYALKHIRILNADGKTWTEHPDIELLESFFANEHYAMVITQEFLKRIQGFLASLPSSQNTKATIKK